MEETKKLNGVVSENWITLQKQVALLAYSLLCIRGYIGAFAFETIYLTLLLNFLIFISIDYRHIKKGIWLLPFFVLLVFYNKAALAIVDIFALVYALRGVSINKIILINFVILFFFICCWQYALALGILKSEILVMPKGIAQTLGYANPNGVGFLGFQIISSLYLLLRKHSKILMLIVFWIINDLFFSISCSRTPWLGGLILLFVLLLMVFNLLRSWMRYIIGIIPAILTVLIIYFAKNIAHYPELDVLFTTRFSLYSEMLGSMSLINWLIGIKIPVGEPMDGSYISLLFEAGIIGLVFFLWIFFRAVIANFGYLKVFMPFIVGILACGVGENTFSSINGLSFIFWFLLMNRGCLYEKIQP